jgi:hypothetical protein
MKRIFPYYDLTATIRYGDKPWPEYPHVELANMDLSDDSIHAFTKRYGPLFADYEFTSPLPRTDFQLSQRGNTESGKKWMDMRMVSNAQKTLREAWRNSPEYLKAIAGHDPEQDAFLYAPMQPVIAMTDTGIELIAPDIWTFIRLAFLRDHAAGDTQICANPNCKFPHGTPYFLQSKRGQLFCRHRCAVFANVRRFRELQKTKPKTKPRSTPKRHKK